MLADLTPGYPWPRGVRAVYALCTLCVLGVTGPGAAAQDIPYDPADLDTCLQTSIADPYQCIGVGAEACYARSGGSNVEYGFCNGAERDDWDARLNVAYQTLLKTQAESTAAIREYRADAPDQVDLMRQMQRNWIAYRDTACEWDYANWGGGSGGGPSHAACMGRLTAQQTILLQQWLPR